MASTVAIAAGVTADTQIKSTPGNLFRVLVTSTAGAGNTMIFDNSVASGKIIGIIPAAVALGTIVDFEIPAGTGITVLGAATNPAITISYS